MLGVARRSAGHLPGQSTAHWCNRKLTDSNIRAILEMDLKGYTLAQIGRKYGVSRERVRQLTMNAGHQPRRERIRARLEAEQHELMERFQKRQDRVLLISELWRRGATCGEIGQFLGLRPGIQGGRKTTVWGMGQSYIGYLRKRYPKLFPYRRPNHWRLTGKLGKEVN